jgi:hypothetical protein
MRVCIVFTVVDLRQPIAVAARFKAWVCGPSLAGVADSNLASACSVER